MDLRNHIVSEGTLKSEDLIEAFMDVLFAVEAVEIINEFRQDYPLIEAYREGHIKRHYLNDDGIARLEDELSGAVNDLHNQLDDNLAPEGFYFGTAEGDGACFGFFRSPIEQVEDTQLSFWEERGEMRLALQTLDEVDILRWDEGGIVDAIHSGYLPQRGLDPHWPSKAHQAMFDYARQHGLLETIE